MLATLASALLLAAPASAEVPAGNLVANPGAEAGAGAADSSTQLAAPGLDGRVDASPRSSTARPTSRPSRTARGSAAGATSSPAARAARSPRRRRRSTSAAAAAEIDAGRVTATLSALIGGYAGQEDAATVTATPVDAAGAARRRDDSGR